MNLPRAFFSPLATSLLALLCLVATPAAHAQGRGGGAPRLLSPEVSADRKITFRLQAPNAQAVKVTGDFTAAATLDMVKDDKGVWSYTTEALKPSSYQYWFVMDGLTMPDPLNTHVRPASGVYKSQVEVPGPEADWLAIRDVPHGSLNEHWYLNRDNGTARRVVIYTPPGYNKSTQSYPVVYLMHGRDDFERGWTQAGRANWIMDNLIAEGKAKPALIVMPFGHPTSGSTGRLPELRALQATLGVTNPPAAGGLMGVDFIEKDLLTNVIPLVESEYRVNKSAGQRAIMGYSMGGNHTLTIGLNHPELFTYLGAFSFPFSVADHAALKDPAKVNKDYKLIWLGVGSDDNQATNTDRAFTKVLTEKGIKHEWTESPGYHHDYQIWRIYLHTVLPKLFRD
jgi:enterochelin esterase-like enzyme